MKITRFAILSAALALSAGGTAWAEDPVGRWTGMLSTANGTIPVGVTITKGADGKLAATAENPSQTKDPIPVETVTSDGKTLKVVAPALNGIYEGVWNDELKSWTGSWKQNGQDTALVLVRSQQ
jgi:hypothetical protein